MNGGQSSLYNNRVRISTYGKNIKTKLINTYHPVICLTFLKNSANKNGIILNSLRNFAANKLVNEMSEDFSSPLVDINRNMGTFLQTYVSEPLHGHFNHELIATIC